VTNLKRIMFETALAESRVAVGYVVVPGLDLPPEAMVDGGRLQYSEDTAIPMRDLEINDTGIAATMSFRQEMKKTFVPWEAIVKMEAYGRFISLWPIEFEGDVVMQPKHQVAS
jgi:hypothetical protein